MKKNNITQLLLTIKILLLTFLTIKSTTKLIYIYTLSILFYFIFILFLIFYLYTLSLKKNFFNKNTIQYNYNSLIKDKEFILFKISLNKFYYSTIIMLFYFLFKNNYFNLISDVYSLNYNTFYLLIFILILYFNLFSNYFTLKLFGLFNKIKGNINFFNSMFSDFFNPLNNKNYFYKKNLKFNNLRTYSTKRDIEPELDTFFESDPDEFIENRENFIKEFKQKYKGGYLGYNQVYHFGNITEFGHLTDRDFQYYYFNLEQKIIEYLKEIPESITYCVLPVLRWQGIKGDYSSITVTNSIKITKNISSKYLARKISNSIHDVLMEYHIRDLDVDLYLMGRPWLNIDNFDVGYSEITEMFNEQIEKEISFITKNLNQENKKFLDKAYNLKNYIYKNIYMGNYGEPVYDIKNNLIGYKLNTGEYVTVETFYNENNLLCNKVFIKELDKNNSSFLKDTLTSWIDIKTDNGFTRNYNNKFYFYDKENNLINVETTKTYLPFPSRKKDIKFNDKIGAIDLETYGENSGLGLQKVYAGGWAIKNKTKLFYIEPKETNEQFINRLFLSILMNKNLNGYTFYVHNLGRFDSIFIIKALILSDKFSITPVWKDNSILSLKVKYNDF